MQKEQTAILVKKAQAGDEQAMGELLKLAHGSVIFQCRKIMAHPEDAEDMAQEVLIRIYGKLDTLQEPEKFLSWANSIAARLCINERRRNPKDLQFVEDEEGHSILDSLEELDQQYVPDAAIDNGETRRMIVELVDALPEAQRTAAYLYYYNELSVREIAEMLGVSENTVKSRLNYARKAIKEGVLDYERKGIKLYGLSPLPFLLYFLRSAAKSSADPAAAAAAADAVMEAGGAVSADVAAEGSSSAAETVQATATSASTAAKSAAGIFSGMGIKIAAAVVVTGALAAGGIALLTDEPPEPSPPAPSIGAVYTESPESPSPPSTEDPAIPPCTPRRTTVDTGGYHAEIYIETPYFGSVSEGYQNFFDAMHAGFNAESDDSLRRVLERSPNATADNPYLYTKTFILRGQDERYVSVQTVSTTSTDITFFVVSEYRSFDVRTGERLSLTDLTGATEAETVNMIVGAIPAEYAHLLDPSYNYPKYSDEFYIEDGQLWYVWHTTGARGSEVPVPLPVELSD